MTLYQNSPIVPGDRARRALQSSARISSRLPVLQLLVLALVYIVGVMTLPGLGTWPSTKLILVLAALAGLASAGQTLLILMGGFDLSIPGFIVGSALIVTEVRASWGISFASALAIVLVSAALLGGTAGQICHRLDIQPLIITLGIGAIFVGFAEAQTPGGLSEGSAAPHWLIDFSSSATSTFGLDIPPLVVTWAAVTVALTIFLHRTTAGRRLLATGASPRAAQYSLVNTRRVWTLAFAFSAVVSSLVGLAVAGVGGSITSNAGDPYLFQSVVAVVVGGTIFGGPGDYLRTTIGALLITVLSVVLIGHGINSADQYMILGSAILLSVSFYGRQQRLRDRM